MRNQLIGSTMSLFVAFAAAAQTSIPSGEVGGRAWQGPIADAFFTDDSMLTLRPHAEITRNWRNLSEMEKDRVRRDCARIRVQPRQAPANAGPAAGADAETATGPDAAPAATEATPPAAAADARKPSPPAPAADATKPSPSAPAADAKAASSPAPADDAARKRGGGAAVSVAGSRSIAEICSIVGSM